MTFQEKGLTVTQKVFEKCGKGRTMGRNMMKRSADDHGGIRTRDLLRHKRADDITFSDTVPEEVIAKQPFISAIPQKDLVKRKKSGFEKIAVDIKKVSQDMEGFWKYLPYVMCDQKDPRFQVRHTGCIRIYFIINCPAKL